MPRRKAYTLIERLIVVAIIGILAAIAVPNFLNAQIRSKIARVQSDQRAYATAKDWFMLDNANRLPGASEIYLLTTPISYIASLNPDPFAPAIPGRFGFIHPINPFYFITTQPEPSKIPKSKPGGPLNEELLGDFNIWNGYTAGGGGNDMSFEGVVRYPIRSIETNPYKEFGIRYDTINGLFSNGDFNRFGETSPQQLQDFYENTIQLLDLYALKMRYPHLSVSMRADDEMHQIAVDIAALAHFMVENNIWLPQSEYFLPFLGLTVEALFQRELRNELEKDGRRSDEPEEKLTFNYDKIAKDFPVIFYFSQNGAKSIPILLDEFQRKERFDVSTELLKESNIERRLRCAALIADILVEESGYQPEDVTPQVWHRIARKTWHEMSRRMADDDEKFKEAATVAFNGRMPFYLARFAYPPDPARYPLAKRSDEEYQRIMKYVPNL